MNSQTLFAAGARVRIGNVRLTIRDWVRFWRFARTAEGKRNQEELSKLRGLYSGRRCFIIGNGPSLNQTRVELLEKEVSIGCNSLFLGYARFLKRPDFYTVEDPLVGEDRRKELKALEGSIKVAPYDLKGFLDGGNFIFVNFQRKYNGFPKFSWDLSRVAYWGGTVTYFNLQLAVYLGCNPIYLIGIDHNYATDFKIKKEGVVWTTQDKDQNHFHPDYFGKGYRWHDPCVDRMEQGYHKAKAEAERRGVKIFNATVGGKLEVFERASFDSLF